jgi:hypothetical protein
MEHLLILTTVERIGDTLPFSPPSQRRRGAPREYLKEYINTLNDVVVLPQIQLHKVMQPLLDLYLNISKTSLTKGCKNRSDVLQRLELVSESKLILLNLFSDYLSFSVPDKSKCLPNHHLQNTFYNYDSDDLVIEELRTLTETNEEMDVMELDQYIQDSAAAPAAAIDATPAQQSTPSRSFIKGHTKNLDSSDGAVSTPTPRAGSFAKRRAEEKSGTNVRSMDDTVAQNLLDLVMTRLLRGYDIGELNPEHILNAVERFQAYDQSHLETDAANATEQASLLEESSKFEYDPYIHGNVSKNNIEVYKDSTLRYIERKIHFKCMEILFKLSCSNPSIVFGKVEQTLTDQNLAIPSTASQLMEQFLKEEQERAAEEKQSQSSETEMDDVSRINIPKDDRIPFDERNDVMNGIKILQIVQYMNLNHSALSKILVTITNQANKHFFKYLEQFDLCNSLRLAIWNWIILYKSEFLSFYSQGRALSGASDFF